MAHPVSSILWEMLHDYLHLSLVDTCTHLIKLHVKKSIYKALILFAEVFEYQVEHASEAISPEERMTEKKVLSEVMLCNYQQPAINGQ